jgi:hypothetical protein
MATGHDVVAVLATDAASHSVSPAPPGGEGAPITSIIGRSFVAAHATLVGAFLLFLLHAPGQVLSAVAQGMQREVLSDSGRQFPATQLTLSLSLSFGAFALAVAVFFLFPLLQGGILGQVRDRLQSRHQPPGPLGAYGRQFYVRLLESQGLVVLAMLGIMVPMMCVAMWLAFHQMIDALAAPPAEGAPPPQIADPQQLTRQLLTQPAFLAGMVILSLLSSAVAIIYWLACSVIVSEQERVLASWWKALRFCWRNFGAVLAVWSLIVVVGILTAPVGLASQLGVVTDLWVIAAVALVNAALIGYVGVLLAGLSMSLYLGRRKPESCEPELCCQPAALHSGKW